MKVKEETIKTRAQFRSLTIDRAAKLDVDARTVELAFSSETPYERYFGTEILDHASKSVRLDRLRDGGALLLNHDTERHIGVVEKVAVGDDRVGRAVVRFGKSAEAEAAFRDVQDGIRRHVSVGYFIHRMVMEEEKEGRETYRVTDWEPIEISLVPIPADPTVGVGRAADDSPEVPTVVVRSVKDEPVQPQERVQIMADPVNKKPEELERERVNALLDLGTQYAKYIADKDVADAIRNGRSVEQFKEAIMQKMVTAHTDTSAMHIGMSRKEVQRYSLGRALLASVTGDWSKAGLEREASQALEKLWGKSPEGFFLPYDIFRRDFNVGTSTEAGNLVATDLRGDLYVDALRNAMVLAGLGVRILPGLTSSIDIPRKSSPTSLSRLTEIGSASETSPLTAKLSLSPKRVGGYVEVSKQALIQSAIALESMIRDDLLMSAAVELEDQLINGNGTSPNILGIRNYTTIGSTTAGANGAAPTWGNFVDLESACANSNAEPDRLAGYLTNTKVRGKLKQTQMGTNLPFIWQGGAQPLNGYRAAITNNVPSNLTKGTSTTVCSAAIFSSDWSMEVIGLFGAPDVVVDPYTKADSGQVKITLNQFSDGGIRQPAAFSKIVDLLA